VGRSVDEWIGSSRLIERRKSQLTIDHIRSWSELDSATGCWVWRRATHGRGYGVLRENGKNVSAHRRAYELATGVKIPRELDACHSCDNPRCVNPSHVFPGSRRDNMRDCSNKGRIRIPLLSGEYLPQSKLTMDSVARIRADDRPASAVAAAYGVCKSTITNIRRGKTWRSA
jgi:hypothetical protein